ncbi:class I SAM-dependent methyltransferase [Sinomicrobium weinanense]|uniref:Class I SAM-dependent methyltransferase n=1 Tax=Sinomicrobium weinanense TaxID=2842200 RepID=A0A926JRB2_9FLAO|nr:class I SAM-dependent methyltransferase [Sinomicrobium weinanense]MBC9795934.1 class I SAM-dependent methyltransferase [Sinomicrobium weinanense]MBU3124687.1 class I SAM-dependent methyltransferase [Sinomicrobium weinanense]
MKEKEHSVPDIIGKALLDYQQGNYTEDIITETSISEEDVLPLPYLFRDYMEMPGIEQKALQLAHGKVLDAGCGAGSHSLYLREERKLDVTAIDISPGAVEACRLRGLKDVFVQDVMQYQGEKFDTILLLMNGLGLCGRLRYIDSFLTHLKSLLNKNGQILLDSSDLLYMFDEDEDGGRWIPSHAEYYGEIEFRIRYKDLQSDPFPWLYIDYNTLQNAAAANGLNCELIMEGEHYDYLAKLTAF